MPSPLLHVLVTVFCQNVLTKTQLMCTEKRPEISTSGISVSLLLRLRLTQTGDVFCWHCCLFLSHRLNMLLLGKLICCQVTDTDTESTVITVCLVCLDQSYRESLFPSDHRHCFMILLKLFTFERAKSSSFFWLLFNAGRKTRLCTVMMSQSTPFKYNLITIWRRCSFKRV